MSPIRRRDLAVLALGLVVASWLLVRTFYGELPSLDWWLPAPLAVLAVGEALGARTVRARLAAIRDARAARRRTTAARRSPVRCVPWSRCWSPGWRCWRRPARGSARGSPGCGAACSRTWPPPSAGCRPRGADTVTAVIGIACSAGLVAAALALESACRVPPEDRDPTEGVSA